MVDMVVKASTKPWPRQLGSSIIRALPPLSQAGRGWSQVEVDFPVAFWIRSGDQSIQTQARIYARKKARVASEQDEGSGSQERLRCAETRGI